MRMNYYTGRNSHSVELCAAVVLVLTAVAAQALMDGSGFRMDYNRTVSDADWKAFKERFKKNYTNPDEDSYRRSIRAQNIELIREHNAEARAGKFHFNLSENSLVDMTVEEYKKLLGYRTWRINSTNTTTIPKRTRRAAILPAMPLYSNTVNVNTLPTSVNWTAQGWVGPVQNQGQCGSCWSYSAAGSLEGQYYNKTRQFVELSEQNLIDCSVPQGNLACNGGNVQNAYWYVQQNGIETLMSYPDTSDKITGVLYSHHLKEQFNNVRGATAWALSSHSSGNAGATFTGSKDVKKGKANPTCQFNASKSVMTAASWLNVIQASEPALQQAVALVGPVSAAIDAKSIQFQLYSGGVYSNQYCSSTPQSLDHAILVVGYGVYNNLPYWLIKNSWGPTWGIKGYMMLARNSNNMCGIATDATFPVVGTATLPTTNIYSNFSRPWSWSTTHSFINIRQGASGSSQTAMTSPLILLVLLLCAFVASDRR